MGFEQSQQVEKSNIQARSEGSTTLRPTNSEMKTYFDARTNQGRVGPEPTTLDFGDPNSLYGHKDAANFGHIPETGTMETNQQLNQRIDREEAALKPLIGEDGKWHFQNPQLPPGQDTAAVIKEALWNWLRPPGVEILELEHERQGIARDNLQLLLQFLTGAGADVQGHYDQTNDRVLQDFMTSPGANEIRKQYKQMAEKNGDYPAATDKLKYTTEQAAWQTLLNPLEWGSVALQVGGFGNPPKEYPWAAAKAMRCDANGHYNPHGDHVEFQVVNVAGRHSFDLHQPKDRPLGSTGPKRSIIQVFQWIEPINPSPRH